jgi:hypothetical protein
MASVAPLNWGRIVLSGVLAGLAGGILFTLFIYATSLLPAHASILSLWQFVASTAFGKAAYGSPSYAWAGLALLLLAAMGWGIGYAYLAQSKPVVNKQPLISGFIFGIIVYIVMQFVLFSVQALKVPDAVSVYLDVVAATVFYGVPVALIARVK